MNIIRHILKFDALVIRPIGFWGRVNQIRYKELKLTNKESDLHLNLAAHLIFLKK